MRRDEGEEERPERRLPEGVDGGDDPDRVRNVPKMARLKVRMTSTMFQTFSIPRRSWIITEWRNAVATSHGMNAAFSTGSHAQ